jgi:concanavalin A-like lectin/glucanase superfamily protein
MCEMKKTLLIFLISIPCFAGYQWQLPRTIDHTKIGSTDATNFTFPVVLTDPHYKTVSNGGYVRNTVACGVDSITCPADLIFSSTACASPTAMNWHFETYSATLGRIAVEVQAASVSHTTDTSYWVCVGNPLVSTFQGGSNGSEWNSNVKMSLPLSDGSTLSVKDATSNANDGTNNSVTAVAGQIDGGAIFSGGAAQDISVPYGASLKFGTGSFSVSMWVNTTDVNTTNEKVFMSANRFATAEGWLMEMGDGSNTSNKTKFVFATFGTGSSGYIVSTAVINDGIWHHLVAVRNGVTISLYCDGVSVGTGTVTVGFTSDGGGPSLMLGNLPLAPTNDWSPATSMDQVQIWNAALGADWITASYNAQKTPSTFSTGATWAAIGPVATSSQSFVF